MQNKYTKAGISHNIVFNWYISDICQYHCSYCYANNISILNTKMSKNIEELVIKRLYFVKEDFEINILGGEPTLNTRLKNIIQNLNTNKYCKKINIITNFHKDIDTYRELNISNKIYFTISYHPEYYSKKVLQKIKKFNTEANIIFLINVDNSVFSIIDEIGDIPYELNFLTNTITFSVNYDNKLLSKIKDKYTTHIGYIPHWIENTKYSINEMDCNTISYKGWHCLNKTIDIDILGNFKNICENKNLSITLKEICEPIICKYEYCDSCKGFYHEKWR